MFATTEADLEHLRASVHPRCVVCSPRNPKGMQLHYEARPDGSVEGRLYCDPSLEGYPGRLHGGVVSSLLDGAMANCLFARGLALVTAELKVRFGSPVRTGELATVRAWVEQASPLKHDLCAEITQRGKVLASAWGTFLRPVGEPGMS